MKSIRVIVESLPFNKLFCLLFIFIGAAGFGCGGKGPVEPGDGQNPSGWSRTFGTKGPDYAWKVAADGRGGIYVAGGIRPDGSESPNPPGEWDCFLSKWNTKGELEWSRTWGSAGWDWCRSVAVDSSGDIYVCGEFSSTVDFDPGPGVDIRTSNGSWDAFLVKYSSNGYYIWAKTWGGDGWEEALDVSVDQTGNVYVAGSVSEVVDFDPGPDVDLHDANYYSDSFLVKYSPLGEYQWGRHWGGVGWDWATGVDASSPGAVYVDGSFSQTVDFDPGPDTNSRTSAGCWDAYLSKYDQQGNLKWVRTWGGPLWDEALEVCVDESQNPNVTGFSESIMDFDPGSDTDLHGIEGIRSAYVTGFDSSGSHRWAETWGVGSENYAYALDSDLNGHIYVTGFYSDNLLFDQESMDKSLKSVGGRDAYCIRLGSSGEVEWSRSWGGYWDDYGLGVVSDHSGYLYVCGVFDREADLDPGSNVTKFYSKGDKDIWLIKMKTNGSW